MNRRSVPAVLWLSGNPDWANIGGNYASALKSVGVPSVRVSFGRHEFNYPNEQIVISDPRHAIAFVSLAQIIVFLHSTFIPLWRYYTGKRLFVFHGGTNYRQNFHQHNTFFSFVEASLIQTYDLLGLGAKNPVWIPPAIDCALLATFRREKSNRDKIVIGHFPSTASKGSDRIINFLNSLPQDKFEVRYRKIPIPWKEHIEQVADCDVYFDACLRYQGQMAYGCWGMAAVEAACLGTVVFTHFLGREDYESLFGVTPLYDLLSDAGFEKARAKLLAYAADRDLLQRDQLESMRWAEAKHSFQIIGGILRNVFSI